MRSSSPRGSLADGTRERLQHMAGDRGYACGARRLNYSVRLLVDTAADSWRHAGVALLAAGGGQRGERQLPGEDDIAAFAVIPPPAQRSVLSVARSAQRCAVLE